MFIPQVHVAAWSRSSRSDRGNSPRVHHVHLLNPGRRHLLEVSRTTTFIDLLRPRAKKGGGTRGKEKSRARGGVVSRETTATWGVRARQGVQDSRDIKIAKPLCLCKNAKFGTSNVKFAKMRKSNAKLLESNF